MVSPDFELPLADGASHTALIVMVGSPGSGKSYLGRAVRDALGAELIQTDAVRKELFPEPRYTPSEAATVYGACHERISAALARGQRVVFDATNLRERQRTTLYRLGERAGVPVFVVVAYAPEAVIRERLRQRMERRDPEDQSDADWAIYTRMRRDAEPVPRPHVIVNTVTAPGPVIRLLKRALSDTPSRAGRRAAT